MSTAVQPERILKELAGLWAGMSKAEAQGNNSGVLRSCAMTLVVAAESDEDALKVSETLAELMHEHPSRAIVLRPSTQPGVMEARVFAQCWMPFGKRQQICCEQIEITASQDRLDEVPVVILGIMAPDLPVVLWARGREWLGAPAFQKVLPLVQKVIIDSATLGDPSRAFTLMRTLQLQASYVGDLAWTRLTRLRQAIANAFEDAGVLGQVEQVREIRVDHTDHPISAAYLAGWLLNAAPKAHAILSTQASDVARISISGPDLNVVVEVAKTVRIQINGHSTVAVLPAFADCDLMREELSILEVDPVYAASFDAAQEIVKGAGG